MSTENIIFMILTFFGLNFGLFIFMKPKETFAIQKKFYAFLNWNIEPISLEKEIRNTKIMGVILISYIIFACVYYIIP